MTPATWICLGVVFGLFAVSTQVTSERTRNRWLRAALAAAVVTIAITGGHR